MEKITSSRVINRYIDLSSLPRYNNSSRINWKNSIGLYINFMYDDLSGVLKIIGEQGENVIIYIEGYTDESGVSINKSMLRSCSLGVILRKRKVFLYEKGDIVNHLKIIDKIKLKEKSYKYICTIDGYEGIITESMLKHGNSCPVCANQKIKIGINDLRTTHPKIASWLLNEEDGYTLTAHTHKKVDWKCNVCGSPVYKKQVAVVTRDNHIFCEHCSQGLSYPEKYFINFLNQLGIEFKKQYSPIWADKYMYDFYFVKSDVEYIIEADGGFHFIDNNLNGQSKEESQKIDLKKDLMASEHGIHVIRINCDYGRNTWISKNEYIRQNIFDSELPTIFDLSNIDFYLCHEYASSSIYHEAIKLFNNDVSLPQICEELHIGLSTLRYYLKDGTKNNLCKYDSFHRRIPIYCTTTGQVFASSTILLNNSKNIFGKKIKVSFKKGKNICKSNGFLFEKISKQTFNKIKQKSPELAFGDFFIL